jgi:hypothetical protein
MRLSRDLTETFLIAALGASNLAMAGAVVMLIRAALAQG